VHPKGIGQPSAPEAAPIADRTSWAKPATVKSGPTPTKRHVLRDDANVIVNARGWNDIFSPGLEWCGSGESDVDQLP
jgi:hypothetical protein